MRPWQAAGKFLEEQRRCDRTAGPSAGVREVGDFTLQLLEVIRIDWHGPHPIASAIGNTANPLYPPVRCAEEAAGQLAKSNNDGSREGRDIDEMCSAELTRVPEAVAQDQTPLGV